MKIVLLGGGALLLLGVVDETLKRPAVFGNPHLVFMDLDLKRAGTMAALATKMPSAQGNMPTAEATDDLEQALDGADFVYCCVRVGGVRAMERDKRIGASHGFHGHDDFGPSAMMLSARTIPVVLKITAAMERLCPNAWLLIYTNPEHVLVAAATAHSRIRNVGLCPGVNNFAHDMDHLFEIGVPCGDLVFRGGGLNHVSWVTQDSTYKGEPVMDLVRREFDDLPNRPGAERCVWKRAAPLVDLYGAMFLNNGHQHHFFFHDELARDMAEYFAKSGPDELRSGKQDRDAARAAELSRQETIEDFWRTEPFVNCAAGPFGELGVNFMEAAATDSGAELCVTTPNYGHVVGITEGEPVETPARIYADRLEPVGIDPVPDTLKGLCNAVVYHQRQVVEAAVEPRKEALLRALMSEPTIRSYERARPMFEELWSAAVAAGEITPVD